MLIDWGNGARWVNSRSGAVDSGDFNAYGREVLVEPAQPMIQRAITTASHAAKPSQTLTALRP